MRNKKGNSMDRSEAKNTYKRAKRPMGVYRIRNLQNDTSYIGFSTDMPSRINRQKTELKLGTHRNGELLADWKTYGESSFAFEVLDELEHDENARANPLDELRILSEMWSRKFAEVGCRVVNL